MAVQRHTRVSQRRWPPRGDVKDKQKSPRKAESKWRNRTFSKAYAKVEGWREQSKLGGVEHSPTQLEH